MATVIDSLLVTLGLDPSAFKKGAAEVKKAQKDLTADEKKADEDKRNREKKAEAERKKQSDQTKKDQKAIAEGFKSIRNDALTIAAIFTGGMGLLAFVRETVTGGAAIGRLSDVTSMSAEELGAWELAAKNAGGSAEGMQAAVLKASQAVAGFKMGMATGENQAFFQFGGEDKHGEMESTKSYLLAMSKLIAQYNATDPSKALSVAQAMGIDYNTFNLLKQGPDAVNRQVQALKGLAGMNNAEARQMQELQEKWNIFEARLSKVGRNILVGLEPAIEEILNLLGDLFKWIGSHTGEIKTWGHEFAEALRGLPDQLKEIRAEVEPMMQSAKEFMNTITPILKMLPGAAETAWKYNPGRIAAKAGGKVIGAANSAAGWIADHLPGSSGASAGRSAAPSSGASGDWHAETHIGQITINTGAKDGAEIARTIGPEIKRQNLAVQANTGTW